MPSLSSSLNKTTNATNTPMKNRAMFKYGTAGFRMRAELLDVVALRMGLFASIVSECLGGRAVGLMVTASHNPEPDNGLKLVGPDGLMAPVEWEPLAERIANAEDSQLPDVVNDIRRAIGCREQRSGTVIVGRDTRKSGMVLLEKIKAGAVRSCKVIDLGLITTPQLHFAVNAYNRDAIPPEQLLDSYYAQFIPKKDVRKRKLTIDFANGVGVQVKKRLGDVFDVNGINEGEGPLNEGCGADHVKSSKTFPKNFVGPVGYSFDGDADRLIGYIKSKDGELVLFDGDRIAALLATYLKNILPHDLNMGIVHTAYSNGAFIEYCQNTLNARTECVPTGVKHLHHAALKYDVGVYFEANGHGTVLFSDRVDWSKHPQIKALKDCLNQFVGDALSDLLAVELALKDLDWTYEQWAAIYKERANQLYKIDVLDRSLFKANASEERLVEPVGLQGKIDALVETYPGSRAFVRPSGTENILRLYVEGPSDQSVNQLAESILDLFTDMNKK